MTDTDQHVCAQCGCFNQVKTGLAKAGTEMRVYTAALDGSKARLRRLIRRALDDGMSLDEVAQVTGYSSRQVGRIRDFNLHN